MATGSIHLPPGAAILMDNFDSSQLGAGLQRVKSSATAPAPILLQLAFDAANIENACWQFRMPSDYASAPVAVIQWKATSATSGGVVWNVSLAAVTSGDSTDVDAKAFATTNAATGTAPATAGYMLDTSVTLTNADSLAASDFVVLRLARNASNGSDTATGDAEVLGVTLTYTTL